VLILHPTDYGLEIQEVTSAGAMMRTAHLHKAFLRHRGYERDWGWIRNLWRGAGPILRDQPNLDPIIGQRDSRGRPRADGAGVRLRYRPHYR